MIYTVPWAPVVALSAAAVVVLLVPVMAMAIVATALLVAVMVLAMTLVASAVALPYVAYRLACRELPRLRAIRVRIPARRRAAAAERRLQRTP